MSEFQKADGIYFNMDEADYHNLPRLSASGMKNLLVSIPTFWAKSWLNTEDADKPDEDHTKAQILGCAYHVAIFEPDTLTERFAGEPDLSDIKNLLTSDTAVCAELKDMGQTQKLSGETPVMRALRLMEMEPGFSVKSVIMGEFNEGLNGQQVIGAKYWTQLLRDVERIKSNPEIYGLVNGGASEVTILWTCPESEIPMKARIDKLKSDLFVDLKSFANANGKPVNEAIRDQVQYYKYYLSMRNYQTAIAAMENLKIMDSASMVHGQMVDDLSSRTSPLTPWLFFQEKGGVPNLLARKLMLQRAPDGVDDQSIGAENHDIKMTSSALCLKADLEIKRAKQLFAQAMAVYGEDEIWYGFDMIGEMGDGDFRDWFLDSVPA